MSLLSTSDGFMCNRKVPNEKVSVGAAMDNTSRPESTMHRGPHGAVSRHFIIDINLPNREAKWHLGYN